MNRGDLPLCFVLGILFLQKKDSLEHVITVLDCRYLLNYCMSN